jgi:hypothetical protein
LLAGDSSSLEVAALVEGTPIPIAIAVGLLPALIGVLFRLGSIVLASFALPLSLFCVFLDVLPFFAVLVVDFEALDVVALFVCEALMLLLGCGILLSFVDEVLGEDGIFSISTSSLFTGTSTVLCSSEGDGAAMTLGILGRADFFAIPFAGITLV